MKAIKLLALAVLVLFAVTSAHAWDWKKCKKPYTKCQDKCEKDMKKKFGDKFYLEDDFDVCVDGCGVDLYKCRLKKNRFKEGRDKAGLLKALEPLDTKRDRCIRGCGDADPKKAEKCATKCEKVYLSDSQDVYENFIDTGLKKK